MRQIFAGTQLICYVFHDDDEPGVMQSVTEGKTEKKKQNLSANQNKLNGKWAAIMIVKMEA